jgi:Rps23 Pro-64 3,4-dihydroxylase Tpa1-like proline 4-hydroxylase
MNSPSRTYFAACIANKLKADASKLKASFEASQSEVGVRYCVIEDLLEHDLALRISNAFPDKRSMRLMSSFREKKYTSKNLQKFDQIITEITFAFQAKQVIQEVESITGIYNQIPDSSLYAGGISTMTNGHYLCPHIDNSHDSSRSFYRTLNLLYYVSPGWKTENGGNLELWNSRVDQKITITSKFNTLVIMETNPTSWHSVSEVLAKKDRKCVSNYYFSETSPVGYEYFHVTSFSAEPGQPVARFRAKIDSSLRKYTRAIIPNGLGKKDVYLD